MYKNQLNGFVVSIVIMLASMTTSQNVNADDASSLAVAVQNPLASLTTLPLPANFNDGVGPYDRRSLLSNQKMSEDDVYHYMTANYKRRSHCDASGETL